MTLNIERLQDLFRIGVNNPITLRAIFSGQTSRRAENHNFLASDYPTVAERWAAFSEQAITLNQDGYNLYTCLNPIRANFKNGAVQDTDITSRRLLLIDLDRSGQCSAPASDSEIKLALQVADDIAGCLLDRWAIEPTRSMSGNGIHLNYPLDDLPNDSTSRDCIRNLLRDLGNRFDTPEIKVDRTVSNASRITKVPGTVARKGTETDTRPYRTAVFL